MSRFAPISRRILIYIGKFSPFILCAIIMLSYMECMYSLSISDYMSHDDYIVVNEPISFAIAAYFKYDALIVALLLVISIAIETCAWNKLAVLYLSLHLLFKHYIESIEIEPIHIYILCCLNIVICFYLILKGVKTIIL